MTDSIWNISRKEAVFLVILFILALFIRFYGVSDNQLIKDEWAILFPRYDSMTNSVSDFVLIPTDNYWNKVSGYDYSTDFAISHINYGVQSSTTPLSWWLVSLSISIFGKNAFGTRFIPLLFGFFSIFIFYFLIKKFYGLKYAFISSFLFSFYLFNINTARIGQTLEPLAIFFFLLSLYFLLSFRKNSRKYWIFFASLMLFSNLPKAIILLGIMFLWEFQNLFINKKFEIKNLCFLLLYYIIALIPSIIWGFIRAKVYDLNYFWILEHTFIRGLQENFRILEVLYSYNSIKQGALLLIPALIGIFIFFKDNYKNKKVVVKDNLNLLWFYIFVLIPYLFLLTKQAGPWSHAMSSFAIVLFSTITIDKMLFYIKQRKYLMYLLVFSASWLYAIFMKSLGDLINMVPRTDSDAIALYIFVFYQIFNSWFFILQILLLISFVVIVFILSKQKYFDNKYLQIILYISLFFSLFALSFYSFYLVINGII